MDIFENIDIYEVEREDYNAYFYRLPQDDLMKTSPEKNYIIWKDIRTGEPICGTETYDIMGQKCTRYFIFNFLEDERLGKHKIIKHIVLSEEDYMNFLEKLPAKAKEN